MEVSDYYELLALLRSVMEAKFSDRGYDTEIVASPQLATVACRIIDALIEIEKQRGDYVESKWDKWRKIDSTRREWKLIRKRIRKIDQWNNWPLRERSTFLDYLLSPLTIGKEDRKKMLKKRA